MMLERAQSLIAAALAAGRAQGAKPLAAVVVDAGGHIVASAREDGATIARHEFALAKAWSCIALGLDTRDLVERVDAHLDAFGHDARAVGFHADADVVVHDPLEAYQNLAHATLQIDVDTEKARCARRAAAGHATVTMARSQTAAGALQRRLLFDRRGNSGDRNAPQKAPPCDLPAGR